MVPRNKAWHCSWNCQANPLWWYLTAARLAIFFWQVKPSGHNVCELVLKQILQSTTSEKNSRQTDSWFAHLRRVEPSRELASRSSEQPTIGVYSCMMCAFFFLLILY